jgi:starch synthase
LVFVDAITTVSETYAKEIQTEELGCGLEGLLKKRKENIFGIINGIDYNLWNPEKDTQLAKVYKPGSVDGKHINKEKLQKECSLPVKKDVPILGVVSRLAEQKGTDILVESLEDILKLNVQVVVLGTGDIRYHKILEKISRKHSLKMSLFLKFDDRLAHNIYAGSDIFLMPSKYEPCGLGQMIALRYGSIPVVFKTGGLADTIIDLKNKKGNGFVFSIYSKKELLSTVERAINAYHKPIWQDLVKEAIGIRFSWDKSAKKYINLFEKIRK